MSGTVIDTLNATAAKYGSRSAMKVKDASGSWKTTTWSEYRDQVRQTGRGLLALGLEPGKGVVIMGNNRPEWFLADVGAIAAGGLPAGIYATNTPEQCQYITDHCDAEVAVLEDTTQLAKFKAVREQLPQLKAMVLMDGDDDADDVYSWDDFMAKAADVDDAKLDEHIAAQKPDDACTLIYTSGTTGPPKAVMITHNNITWTAGAAVAAANGNADDVMLSYLPLSHVAEQTMSLHGPMNMGATTYFAESIEALGENLREVRPTIFLAVPRVWEKIQAKMMAAGAQNPPLKKKIAAWARGVGLQGGYAEQHGRPKPLLWPLAHKLVFSKVREKLGMDRARICITSAAPISKDTLEFFLSLGIPIMEVYGMSECTGPATLSLPHHYRTAMAGPVLPGAEMKIAEDGEVCMRGGHVFKGYFKNETATRETIDDEGWLHSGDIGTIDKDGFLKITDRKKDLIITAGGENIAPQLIEGQLKSIKVVAQAVVIGDRKKYLSALITLDPEAIESEAAAAGSKASSVAEAATCDVFRKYLDDRIQEVNAQLARVQTIKRYTIVPHEFTIDGGELTPTMKIKRKVINEKYESEIQGLYA